MKIVFTTQALTIGGIEVLALRFSEAFGKVGHNVILYDFNSEWRNEELVARYDTKFYRLEYLGKNWKTVDWLIWKVNSILFKSGINKNFRQKLVERHFARLLEREKPDVVCSLSFHYDYIACKAALPLGVPVVVSMHGTYEYASPEWPEKAKFIHDHVKAFIYAADKNMSWYRAQSYFNKDIPATKIYTGTDLHSPVCASLGRKDLGISNEAFVFVMVARGIKEKGWSEVLHAFRRVKTTSQDAMLLLVGEGEYLQNLRSEFIDEPGVIFYGSHPNSVELTALANVGLLPSYFPIETMPNVIIDYLRCSLPVIASSIGEIPMMLQATENTVAGAVLPLDKHNQGVEIESLYSIMHQFVIDQAFYNSKVELAKIAAKKFDLRTCVSLYTDVFNKVVAK